MKYTLLNSDQSSIPGLRFRQSRQGPEADMVRDFLHNLDVKAPRGCSVTLFQEPRLDSGFPDLVVVVWHRATAEKWNPVRLQLHSPDIRVLHYLTTVGASEKPKLEGLFGPKVADTLEKLEAAEMVRHNRKKYTARSLSSIYATRSIIAIEAKVSEWRDALDQAFTNRWFASESRVLLPKVPKGSVVISQAESLGVGVWSMSDACHIDVRGISVTPPISYASWLFNEWAWRALVM